MPHTGFCLYLFLPLSRSFSHPFSLSRSLRVRLFLPFRVRLEDSRSPIFRRAPSVVDEDDCECGRLASDCGSAFRADGTTHADRHRHEHTIHHHRRRSLCAAATRGTTHFAPVLRVESDPARLPPEPLRSVANLAGGERGMMRAGLGGSQERVSDSRSRTPGCTRGGGALRDFNEFSMNRFRNWPVSGNFPRRGNVDKI